MFELTVVNEFAAAHALRGYNGSCEKSHGHNFQVEVVVSSAENKDLGMVVDFCDLEKMLLAVLEYLDHDNLNDLPPFTEKNATSENIAKYIFQRMQEKIGELARVSKVIVWENARYKAAYLAS